MLDLSALKRLFVASTAIVGGLLLVGILISSLTPWGTGASSERSVYSQVSGADLQFNPSSSSVNLEDTFSVDVEIIAGTQSLDTASAFVDFDPAKLQVHSITGGPTLPIALREAFDNSKGQIDIVRGILGSTASGTFTLATIEFKATGVGQGILTFSTTGVRKTAGLLAGEDVTGFRHSGSAMVGGATAISIMPASQTVAPGDTFQIQVVITPETPIAGAQLDLSFDSSLLQVQGVEEGGLLSQGGASTFFQPGSIDDDEGSVAGIAGVIITPGQTVSLEGIFAVVTFQAKGTAEGSTLVEISNTLVGDLNAQPVPVIVHASVVMVDGTPPALALPAPATLEATGLAGADHTFKVTATDNSDTAPEVTCNPPSGSTFPLGITEVVCTATDSSGNNAIGSFTITVAATSIDVDQNGVADATSDGVMIIRYLFGFSGAVLTEGVIGEGAQRTSPDEITIYLDSLKAADVLDIDDNGTADALSDGLLLLRYLFGFSGEYLTRGVIGGGAQRVLSDEIIDFLDVHVPTPRTILEDQGNKSMQLTNRGGIFEVLLCDIWDVNCDGQVSVLDMIIVGQNWGGNGIADVNRDGKVNVLDMILIGQHWTG